MYKPSNERPEYGNWVSMRLVLVPAALALLFLCLTFLFQYLILLTLLFLVITLYFAYARYLFSPRGGNIQYKIRNLVVSKMSWSGEGRLLDIGCGSGSLTIELAEKYPNAQVVGVDHWGAQWDYSRQVCERNAEIEGVSDRITFKQASAVALPFEDGSLDAVVSNLVFHEVGGVKDKKELVREALRVLRPGGVFVLQDLFMWKMIYGEPKQLIETMLSWGVQEVELINTSESPFIPPWLKLPFMAGTIGMLAGKK